MTTTRYPATLTFDTQGDDDMAASIILACEGLGLQHTLDDSLMVVTVHVNTPQEAFRLGIAHIAWLQKLNHAVLQ